MKILITGVSGFIGKSLAKKLLSKGHNVIGTDINEVSIPGMDFLKLDIFEKDGLKSLVFDSDIVVHLAAITDHESIVNKSELTRKINLDGTRNILEIFSNSFASKFIYASTGKVYGKPDYLPYDEKHPLRPSNILGKSKKEVEDLILSYSDKIKDKSFIIFRMFQVYGCGQKEQFLFPTLLKQIIDEGKTVLDLGDIESKRDYIHINDVIDAFLRVIESKINGLKIYNVGTGKSFTVKEILGLFENKLNKEFDVKINSNKLRFDEFSDERADITKLIKLGWKPNVSLSEGVDLLLRCKQ